jgi:hypothetical protein
MKLTSVSPSSSCSLWRLAPFTLTRKVLVVVLPELSVAVQMTLVRPTVNTSGWRCSHRNDGAVDATAVSLMPTPCPRTVSRAVKFSGTVRTGGTLSPPAAGGER